MVPQTRLTQAKLEEYIADLGMPIDETKHESFIERIQVQQKSISKLDRLSDSSPPERAHWEPDEECDEFGGFLTRCDIQESSSGPLSEMTVAVKDNIAVAGIPMTCGSPLLEDYEPTEDATVISRLLEAGARIVGKANQDEFAHGGSDETMRFRKAYNPHNPEYHPGSSSSGSGVTVASDLVDVALGTDTGGSVRGPASFSGVVGIKPTRGLVSHHGLVHYSKLLDTIGVLSQDTLDCARVLEAIAGQDPKDGATSAAPTRRYTDDVIDARGGSPTDLVIGLPQELFGHAPELEEVVNSALNDLQSAGATLKQVSISNFDLALPAYSVLSNTELSSYFEANAVPYNIPTEPDGNLTERFESGFSNVDANLTEPISADLLHGKHLIESEGNRYYPKAQRARSLVTDGVDDVLEDVDVLASLTFRLLPPKWGEDFVDSEDVPNLLAQTAPFNLTGHPAISVPSGWIDGFPVGLQFVGPRFGEEHILKAAAYLESICDMN